MGSPSSLSLGSPPYRILIPLTVYPREALWSHPPGSPLLSYPGLPSPPFPWALHLSRYSPLSYCVLEKPSGPVPHTPLSSLSLGSPPVTVLTPLILCAGEALRSCPPYSPLHPFPRLSTWQGTHPLILCAGEALRSYPPCSPLLPFPRLSTWHPSHSMSGETLMSRLRGAPLLSFPGFPTWHGTHPSHSVSRRSPLDSSRWLFPIPRAPFSSLSLGSPPDMVLTPLTVCPGEALWTEARVMVDPVHTGRSTWTRVRRTLIYS